MEDAVVPPPTRRSLWVIVSTVVCCALMGSVIALAVKGRAGEAPPARPQPTDPKRSFVPPLGPQNPCGALDPDNPAAITIEATKGEVDFGTASQGEKLTRELTIRSTGAGPLCIFRLKSGCGCFKVSQKNPERRRLAPGEHATLVITMDSSGKVGQLRKIISIYTNSMDNPVARVTCRVDVSKGLILNRRTLYFRSVPSDTATSTSLLMHTPRADPDWTVTKVEGTRKQADGKTVAYTFRIHDIPDGRFRKRSLEITHPGTATVGRWNEDIRIHTTHPDRKVITLQGYLHVVNRILTKAHRVSLGHVKPGEPSKPSEVRFVAGDPSVKFKLMRAFVAPPSGGTMGVATGFLAKVGEDEKGWFVTVHYDGRARPPGLLEGELVVRTSDAQQPEIRLPVRATIVDQ